MKLEILIWDGYLYMELRCGYAVDRKARTHFSVQVSNLAAVGRDTCWGSSALLWHIETLLQSGNS